MTFKQAVLKKIYPLIMQFTKSSDARGRVKKNTENATPVESIYDLKITLNNDQELDLKQFKGKKMLLVNTASNCGYTGQYEELQQLHEKSKCRLVIIGFSANDFKEQEKGNDSEIAQFCQLNFGVTFPLSKKSHVVKGKEQHPVYQWLTQSEKNGWNNRQPEWNFSKYLIDENGILTHYFGSAVSPLSSDIV